MAELVWDQVGDRTYQTGVDRGVLYLPENESSLLKQVTNLVRNPRVAVDDSDWNTQFIPMTNLGSGRAVIPNSNDYGLRLYVSNPDATNRRCGIDSTKTFAVTPGVVYSLSVDVFAVDVEAGRNNPYLWLAFFDSNGAFLSQIYPRQSTPIGQHTRMLNEGVVAPAGAALAKFRVSFDTNVANDVIDVYVTNWMFNTGYKAAPYHDGDSPGAIWNGTPHASTSTKSYYGTAVVWNGLTSVEEKFGQERKSYYLDGVKYLDHVLPGDFSAQLKAFTYPDEFERINGVASGEDGVSIHDQKPMSFSLSYRTRIGDDVSGTDRGYKLHLLYNLTAVPDNNAYTSLGDQNAPIEFGWDLSGTPVAVPGYRPTVHISFDSTKIEPALLLEFENTLYGSSGSDAVITILDNGDGTWTANGPDDLITMLDSTTGEISGADVVHVDADTYEVTTASVGSSVETNPRLPSIQEIFAFIENWGSITDNGDGTWTAVGDITMLDSTTFQIENANAVYSNADTYNISST